MAFWILFWKVFFILILVLFAGMAVWVTIGGFRDLKKLFKNMESREKEK